jgi:hypothetical protein
LRTAETDRKRRVKREEAKKAMTDGEHRQHLLQLGACVREKQPEFISKLRKLLRKTIPTHNTPNAAVLVGDYITFTSDMEVDGDDDDDDDDYEPTDEDDDEDDEGDNDDADGCAGVRVEGG